MGYLWYDVMMMEKSSAVSLPPTHNRPTDIWTRFVSLVTWTPDTHRGGVVWLCFERI